MTVSYHRETKNLSIKKGHKSGKNCRKIVIIELDLDIHKIHIHTTPKLQSDFFVHEFSSRKQFDRDTPKQLL